MSATGRTPATSPNRAQALLIVLKTISGQQAQISKQFAELIEHTTSQPDSTLIERLSDLLQPLFKDMAEIRQKVKHLPTDLPTP